MQYPPVFTTIIYYHDKEAELYPNTQLEHIVVAPAMLVEFLDVGVVVVRIEVTTKLLSKYRSGDRVGSSRPVDIGSAHRNIGEDDLGAESHFRNNVSERNEVIILSDSDTDTYSPTCEVSKTNQRNANILHSIMDHKRKCFSSPQRKLPKYSQPNISGTPRMTPEFMNSFKDKHVSSKKSNCSKPFSLQWTLANAWTLPIGACFGKSKPTLDMEQELELMQGIDMSTPSLAGLLLCKITEQSVYKDTTQIVTSLLSDIKGHNSSHKHELVKLETQKMHETYSALRVGPTEWEIYSDTTY
eukprot:gene3256-5962_t